MRQNNLDWSSNHKETASCQGMDSVATLCQFCRNAPARERASERAVERDRQRAAALSELTYRFQANGSSRSNTFIPIERAAKRIVEGAASFLRKRKLSFPSKNFFEKERTVLGRFLTLRGFSFSAPRSVRQRTKLFFGAELGHESRVRLSWSSGQKASNERQRTSYLFLANSSLEPVRWWAGGPVGH